MLEFFIKQYRRVSYRGQRCSAPDPFNCSTLALEAVQRARRKSPQKKLRAAMFAFLIVGTCGECYDNPDAKPWC